MDLVVRPITSSEVDLFRARMARAFGENPSPEDASRFLRVVDLDRTVAAFDGDDMIGTCAAFGFDVTVPGGTLPMGGTTLVTVQPTHRRRGVVRAIMEAHLREIRERGEPLAGLWASESSIYGRFGYGLAAEKCDVRLQAPTIHFRGEPGMGTVRLVTAQEAAKLLPGVYDRVRPTRPGMFTRSDAWWETRIFHDPEHWRDGRSVKRWAVTECDGEVQGYVVYRQKDTWDDFPEGEVFVLELVSSTPSAHEALWRFLTRIDLFPNVRYWNAPADDELPWRVTEPRRVRRQVNDSLWIRLVDIPRALAGRSYSGQGRLVMGIVDPFMPPNDGRYALDVGPGGAACRPTDADPDVELGVDTLGALYLGGHRATTMARAGLIKGSDDSLATMDRLFSWAPLPWCPEDF